MKNDNTFYITFYAKSSISGINFIIVAYLNLA